MKNEIMVSVATRAYMQETMIRQTLDALMAQQTTYPFEVIVGENHGTDKTLAICREYEAKYDNIKVFAQEKNVGAQVNLLNCIQKGAGKYIMICDGDDWWHNPKKIQMQVDFMESHPECVILHTDYDVYNDRTGKTEHNVKMNSGVAELEGMIQKELFDSKTYISFPTICIRRSAFETYVPLETFIEKGGVCDDYFTWVVLASYGEIRYLPISTATYRVGRQSITNEVSYERVIKRREADKQTLKLLYSMFPNLGIYHEEEHFNDYYSHQLLLAAYRNNDYVSARKFAKQDRKPTWRTYMAFTWLTFQMARHIKPLI
jgi:glycosyltransferase involved in cell wall biosynthesis